MSSLLSALLGLGIGLGTCVAAVYAWRARHTHKQHLQHTIALRQATEMERGKAEAAQRAASLAQREIALSELAKRREALKRRRDVPPVAPPTPLEPPPPPETRSERLAGERIERNGRVPAWSLSGVPKGAIAPPQSEAALDASAETTGSVAEEERPRQSSYAPVTVPPGTMTSVAALQREAQTGPDGVASGPEPLAAQAGAIDREPPPPTAVAETLVEPPLAPLEKDDPAVVAASLEASRESSQELPVAAVEAAPDVVPDQEDLAAPPSPDLDAPSRLLPIAREIEQAVVAPGEAILETTPSPDLAASPEDELVDPVQPNHTERELIEEQPAHDLLLTAPVATPVLEDQRPSTGSAEMGPSAEPEAQGGLESSDVAQGGADVGSQASPEAPGDPAIVATPPSAPFDEASLLVTSQAREQTRPVEAEAAGPETTQSEPTTAAEVSQRPDQQAAANGLSGEESPGTTPDELPQFPDVSFIGIAAPSPQQAPARRFRPTSRDPSRVRATRPGAAPAAPRERALVIDLRLHMQLGGRCSLTLLGRRHEDLPDQVTVATNAGNLELSPMQDGWFEGVRSDDLGRALETGVQWTHQAGADTFRWLLSGRPIYVLAQHNELSGFVNTTRLELGERHVVLCTQERAAEVRAALAACGAQPTSDSGAAHGLPSPWIAIHGVTPTNPVQASSEGSHLDCLCPRSDAELHLTGGIKLGAKTWLTEFPPRISLRGDPTTFGQLFIDQKPAQQQEDGSFSVPGWDSPGRHVIAWSTGTRRYAIQDPPRSWAPWSHASTETPLLHNGAGGRSVCGALVTRYQTSAADTRAVLVPSTNTLLLGALPGQIWGCEEASHLPGSAPRVGFPPFDPIWATPPRALRCDKRQAAVMLLPEVTRETAAPSIASLRRGTRSPLKPEVRAWCAAILDASRKGLAVSPADPAAVALWNEYRMVARQMTRSAR